MRASRRRRGLDRRHHRRGLDNAHDEDAMTGQAKLLAAVTESLRTITSVRDFVTAVEVDAKVAGEMLDEIERDLLDAITDLNKDLAP
jgi:hypothetical protein